MSAPAALPPAPAMHAVRYLHPHKQYEFLAGMAGVLPAIYGLEASAHAAALGHFEAQARRAADDLLAEPALSVRLRALPFEPGHRVLAIGDSLTDDLQSWVEILAHALRSARPDQQEATFVNAAVSAATTTSTLARWPALLTPPPDWIVCALGTNDLARTGPQPTKTAVSAEESVANLRQLRWIAATLAPAARWLWITPAPIDDQRVAAHPGFRYAQVTWQHQDAVELTDAVRRLGEEHHDPVVDLSAALDPSAHPHRLEADGLHPSPAGQAVITTALIRTLAPDPQNSRPADRAAVPT